MRRFDNAPMILLILFKTVIYWAVVLVARFLEGLVEYLIDGGTLGELPSATVAQYCSRMVRSDPDLDLRAVSAVCLHPRTERAARGRVN